jgi:ABC-type multidrug transport system fused ATPase/permease subunit
MLSTIRKIFDLFEPRERWTLAGLCGVIVVVALVQTAGVASIMPFMSMVANPEMIGENQWMRRLYEYGQFESPRAFLLFAGLALLVIMAISNASAALEHWLMLRFIWRKQHRFSVRLLEQYLREPYTFYLNQNTAALAKNILAEIGEVVNGVLLPGMRMLAQSVIIIAVFALLIAVDPMVALLAATGIGGSYVVIFIYVRRRQSFLGNIRRTSNVLRFKTAAEALGSIKETKVLGREAEFVRRFNAPDRRYSNANASNAMVADIPRFALETLAFGGIVLVVLYLLQTREDFGEAVAVVSLYALAAYRLMPALQAVFRGLARVRFFLPALDSLHVDLKRGAPQPEPHLALVGAAAQPIPFQRRISLDGVGYTYPGSDSTVIRNINLQIRRNTSVAFVGSTGCGKTTLVDILLGLLEPQHGSIRIDDTTLTPANIRAWQNRLGYVPQNIYLSDDTVTRNIAFGVPDKLIDHAAVERAARTADLHEFITGLGAGYDTIVGERGVRLSGGQRQRIGIARALYGDPDVLIMDEATSALDGITEDTVIQAIRDLAHRKTIILVAHRLTTVRDCDVIYMFDRGEIVASGAYHELMQTNVKFRTMARGMVEEAAVG